MNEVKAGFSWPEGKRAAVSLSFDDARESQWRTGIPLLDAYGVKATFYVVPRSLEAHQAEWQKASASGHEMGNHTVSHPCSGNFPWSRANAIEEYTLERMDDEMARAGDAIQQLLGVNPVTFAYPCGQKYVGCGAGTQSTIPLVARRFLAGRGFRDESTNDPLFCDLAQLAAVDADGLSFEQYLKWVENARSNGGWLILAGHDIGNMDRQAVFPEALKRLCAYCQKAENEIWIDTVAEIAGYIAHRRESTTAPQ